MKKIKMATDAVSIKIGFLLFPVGAPALFVRVTALEAIVVSNHQSCMRFSKSKSLSKSGPTVFDSDFDDAIHTSFLS